jgi:hypothetical protein
LQSPIREQIRLDGRWQARPVEDHAVSVFVPGAWEEKRVVLEPAPGIAWADALAGGTSLPREPETGVYTAGPHLAPGQWNTVSLPDGDPAGGRLVASAHLHICCLEAAPASNRSLAVRVKLDGPEGGAAAQGAGLLSIVLTLTAPDGSLLGGTDLTIASRTRDLSVELPLPGTRSGAFRLKATLCADEQILDNARIDFHA